MDTQIGSKKLMKKNYLLFFFVSVTAQNVSQRIENNVKTV